MAVLLDCDNDTCLTLGPNIESPFVHKFTVDLSYWMSNLQTTLNIQVVTKGISLNNWNSHNAHAIAMTNITEDDNTCNSEMSYKYCQVTEGETEGGTTVFDCHCSCGRHACTHFSVFVDSPTIVYLCDFRLP